MKLLIFLQCCVLLCKLAAGNEGEGCREAFGMENGKIADDQITASSEKEAYPAVNGRLHYTTPQGRPFGWQPKNSSCIEWLLVDLLLDNSTITGVATQGCSSRTSKSVLSVTKYELEFSNDSKAFYADHRLYAGNTDEDTVVYHTLDTPMKARYVRFQPKFWKNGICMRVELYGKITTACDSSPCLNGGTCFEDESRKEYICKCSSGWKGDNCEKNMTACDSSPCLNGGICHEEQSGQGYTCKCSCGWKGDNCENKTYTACDSSPCLNGGTCFEDESGEEYICKCGSGWRGNNCEKNMTACDSSPCLNGGICHEAESGQGYTCKCRSGWIGDNCQKKTYGECLHYKSLTNGNRKVSHGSSPLLCDNTLPHGWYRFQGNAGTKMPSSCVAPSKCSTHATGWLNGAHPSVEEGKVTKKVCFSWASNCCTWSINIEVLNCGDFFLYHFQGTPPEHPCHLRYCGTD